MVEVFEVEQTAGEGPGVDPAAGSPDFNVAPTRNAPVVLERVPRPAEGEQPEPDGPPADAVRWLRLLRWGLVPAWAKDRSVGSRMINARAETLLEKPAYKRAATSRRCLVPADGWFEWQVSPTAKDTKGKPRKQPFFMSPADGDGPITFAGIYEFWRDPAVEAADDPAAWLTTFAVITTAAEPALTAVHDRMPLVLPRERWADWLDPGLRAPDDVRTLLLPPEPGRFVATPVSSRVNAVANNGPDLLDPVPVDQLHGVLDPQTGELIP